MWHFEMKNVQKTVLCIQTRCTDLNISVSSVHQYMTKHQKNNVLYRSQVTTFSTLKKLCKMTACMSVCPSVHMQQLSSELRDFCEI
jgi:hypothetical protein